MARDEKLPYMRWYPSDLDAEPTLKLCSWDSCWLWIKLLGMMHHSPQRGYLLKANGEPYTESDLVTSIAGATPDRIRDCLFELGAQGVYSKDRRGILYCRKMVKGEVRAKNLDKEKKNKTRDKLEINRSKNEDKSDLASPTTHENIKDNSGSYARSVVKPESRIQKPEKKDLKQQHQPAPRAVVALGNQIAEITGWADDPRWFGDYSRIDVWLKAGYDPELDILATVRRIMAKRTGPPNTLKFFEQAIADAHAFRLTPVPKGNLANVRTAQPTRSSKSDAAIQRALDKFAEDPEPETHADRQLGPPVV